MYTISVKDHLYKKWNLSPVLDLELESDLSLKLKLKLKLIINPLEEKLFNDDNFIFINNKINNKNNKFNNGLIEIIESPIRKNKYIAGILDLSKTYGKENKMLYLCKPDNKHLPYFLIPYSIPPSYDKTKKHLYITFEFKNWENVHPYGSITQNIGCIDIPENFYEYMLYCKNLNVSIQPFTKSVIKNFKEKNIENNIEIKKISDKYKILERKDRVFTIDSKYSIDLDDGISIKDDIISIYITHVPIIIDYLNLWNAFTKRVSTIYLPDKKKSMLPPILTQLCSLNEKEERICLIMDINIKEGKFINNTISIGQVKIHKNYKYEEDRLLTNKDYNKIKEICGVNNSYEVIEYLMVYFNQECAKKMNNGIYKSYIEIGMHPVEKYMYKTTKYTYAKTEYAQFTSPIRRLVDILNIIQIHKQLINTNQDLNKIQDLNENTYLFYNDWYSKINEINEGMTNIKKVQNKCKLLDTFNKCSHQVFKGIVIGINENTTTNINNYYKYDIYLPELKITTHFTCANDTDVSHCLELKEEYLFKIYVFNNEGEIKKKIKIQLQI